MNSMIKMGLFIQVLKNGGSFRKMAVVVLFFVFAGFCLKSLPRKSQKSAESPGTPPNHLNKSKYPIWTYPKSQTIKRNITT